MKVMTVVGARPNFMKAAPIIAAIQARNTSVPPPDAVDHVLVHTGQHYDQVMSESFFADLGLPKPHYNLGVGSASHAVQTAEIMRQFEGVLLREEPDFLIAVGDVNSTVACALVAAKISFDESGTRPLIAHVEAGLRSFDRNMPEEINRILTDQLADLLFVTEQSGLRNLAREGVASEKIHFVGNTMIDSLLACREKAEASTILADLGLRRSAANNGSAGPVAPYALLTLHRPANVDTPEALSEILEGLGEIVSGHPVIFPAHPRTRKRIEVLNSHGHPGSNGVRSEALGANGSQISHGIHMIEPLGYLDFLCLMKNAAIVITDSGGIQEETTCLGVPCVTVRENTERPVTLEAGTNTLGGVNSEGIRQAVRRQFGKRFTNTAPEKWDGKAGIRIVDVLLKTHRQSAGWKGTVPCGSC